MYTRSSFYCIDLLQVLKFFLLFLSSIEVLPSDVSQRMTHCMSSSVVLVTTKLVKAGVICAG